MIGFRLLNADCRLGEGQLRLRAIQGKTRGKDETGWWTRGLAYEQTIPKSEVFFQRSWYGGGGGGYFFLNLHSATCVEQLAQTNLHRPVCAEHLAWCCLALASRSVGKKNASCSVGPTSLAMFCFRANRGLVFLPTSPNKANNKRAMNSTLWGHSSCPLFLPGS